MQGKTSIAINHCNDADKQKISLTYYLGPFDNVAEAQRAKFALDEVAKIFGAEVASDALILDSAATEAAKKEAEELVTEEEAPEAPPIQV